MSAPQRARSVRALLWMAGAAAVSAALALIINWPQGAPASRAEVGRLVLPAFADRARDVRLVMVSTSEESYHLTLDGDGWVMPEKDRYPVRADRITDLVNALSALRFGEAMTRDDKKFDRIGLGDPGSGGTGARLEVGDGQGDSFADLIIGYRDGRTYLRQPDDLQAWAVEVDDMPPLQRAAAWLDFSLYEIAPDEIAEVSIRPLTGLPYVLRPADEHGAQFDLAPPFDRRPLAAPLAANPPALAATRFLPIDVAADRAIASGRPAGEHITRLKSGLDLSIRLWRTATGGWAVVVASIAADAAPGVKARSDAINAKTRGWAFRLTDADFATLLSPLQDVAAN